MSPLMVVALMLIAYVVYSDMSEEQSVLVVGTKKTAKITTHPEIQPTPTTEELTAIANEISTATNNTITTEAALELLNIFVNSPDKVSINTIMAYFALILEIENKDVKKETVDALLDSIKTDSQGFRNRYRNGGRKEKLQTEQTVSIVDVQTKKYLTVTYNCGNGLTSRKMCVTWTEEFDPDESVFIISSDGTVFAPKINMYVAPCGMLVHHTPSSPTMVSINNKLSILNKFVSLNNI